MNNEQTAALRTALNLHLVSTEHGFRDFDVIDHPVIRRATVASDIRKGDYFNVYHGESSKAGAKWFGNLEKSLAVWLTIQASEGVEDIDHPFTKFSLADAIYLANDCRELNALDPVSSATEAREVIQGMLDTASGNWLTGKAAMDVLDAAIDKRDLKQSSCYR